MGNNEVNTAKGKQAICKHFKSALQSARRVHQGRGVYFKSALQSARRVHQGRGVYFKSALQSARRVHQGRGVYFKSALQSARRVHQGSGVGREGDPPHCARDPAAIIQQTVPLFCTLGRRQAGKQVMEELR